MKSKIIMGTTILASAQPSLAIELIKVGELSISGISQDLVINKFQSEGINLNQDELLEMSTDEEGKKIKFETMDNISVNIDINSALGIGNKDRSP
jgi:hypothetical protein